MYFDVRGDVACWRFRAFVDPAKRHCVYESPDEYRTTKAAFDAAEAWWMRKQAKGRDGR